MDPGGAAPHTDRRDLCDRLIATIRAARPVLESPGVLLIGSEVPNPLEQDSAATLVVSQDLDVGVPVDRHAALKPRLGELRLHEPSAGS